MARVPGVEEQQAPWWLRLFYKAVRRETGSLTGLETVAEPTKIAAHSPRLMWTTTAMEWGQLGLHSTPAQLRSLASAYVGSLIGCPF